MRDAHFPPERNFLAAHVTLFHHLPGPEHAAIAAALAAVCAEWTPFPVRVARLQSLGSFRETLIMESAKQAIDGFDDPELKALKYGPLTETPVKNVAHPLKHYKLV